MTDWFEELKSQVLVVLPNMPTNYVENAILKATQTFFQETELLEDDAYIDVQCNVNDYVIDLPQDRVIIQAKAVYAQAHPDRHPLVSSAWACVPPAESRFDCGWWIDLSHRQPTLAVNGRFAARSGQYALRYSWAPTGRDCDMPYHFIAKYLETLQHGALHKLFLLPTDADTQSGVLANFHLREFRSGINRASNQAIQNHTNRPLFMQGTGFL